MIKGRKNILFFLVLESIILSLFFSCSTKTDDKAFLATLDYIDKNIAIGQTEEALHELNIIAKKVYSPYGRIGLYRRYIILGETNRAENILITGLKNNPNNRDLSAVYGQFLLRQNRIKEALQVTNCLSGTPFGSIFAESYIRSNYNHGKNSINNVSKYLNENYITVNYDAFTGTRDIRWLINNSLISVLSGNIKSALDYKKYDRKNSNYQIYWALLEYDNRNFENCIKILDNIDKKQQNGKYQTLENYLYVDSYVELGDYYSAEKIRQVIMNTSSMISPSIIVNSALWAKNNNEIQAEYGLLLESVTKNPYYVPGLIQYGNFALLNRKTKNQTLMETDIRTTSLKTIKMKLYDALPSVPLSDAILRLNNAIEQEKKSKGIVDSQLLIEVQKLVFESNNELSDKSRVAEIWKLLENNQINNNYYPLLVEYAIHELILLNQTESASELFFNYLYTKYSLNKLITFDKNENNENEYDSFGGEKSFSNSLVTDKLILSDKLISNLEKLDKWEGMVAAYFFLTNKNYKIACCIYEYLLIDNNQGDDNVIIDKRNMLNYLSSAANLAMIYSSTGNKKKALDIYQQILGKTSDKKFKSLILFRIACIQYFNSDYRNAILSLEYSISLDSKNYDSLTLLQKIKFEEK